MITLAACQSSGGPEPTLIVEGGRVIVGDGTVFEEASVVIAGDSIHSVTEGSVEAEGARRINASGKTVLPGLIDAHVHLTIPPDGRDSAAVARHLENRVPGILQGFLENGVTTVRSTGEYWPSAKKLRNRIASGNLQGPRMITSGPVFTAEGGHPASTVCTGDFSELELRRQDSYCRDHLAAVVTGPEEARADVQRLAEEDVDFIKVISDSINAPVQIDGEIVEAIVDQAHKEGLRVVGHVFEDEFMEAYAKIGMDGFAHPAWGLVYPKPVPEKEMRRFAQELTKKETPVTTTLTAGLLFQEGGTSKKEVEAVFEGESPARKLIELVAQEVATFSEAGVPIVVGTDWWSGERVEHPAVKPGTATITEMKMLRWAGMSQEDILKAATADAAGALEMSDRLGSLEEGKLADLIVVEGNPLTNLSALDSVETVVKGGTVVAGLPTNRTPK